MSNIINTTTPNQHPETETVSFSVELPTFWSRLLRFLGFALKYKTKKTYDDPWKAAIYGAYQGVIKGKIVELKETVVKTKKLNYIETLKG